MGADYYDNKERYTKRKYFVRIGKIEAIKKGLPVDKNVRIGEQLLITPENKSSNLISEKFYSYKNSNSKIPL